MELQGEHPRQWWLFNEVSGFKQPSGREQGREAGKAAHPHAFPQGIRLCPAGEVALRD